MLFGKTSVGYKHVTSLVCYCKVYLKLEYMKRNLKKKGFKEKLISLIPRLSSTHSSLFKQPVYSFKDKVLVIYLVQMYRNDT